MHALSTWTDEAAFHTDDPRRRLSLELDLGATWRRAGANDAGRLAWRRETGELYVCRADGYDGSCTDVLVLAVVHREQEVDAMLAGWREHRFDPDGLSWVVSRATRIAA